MQLYIHTYLNRFMCRGKMCMVNHTFLSEIIKAIWYLYIESGNESTAETWSGLIPNSVWETSQTSQYVMQWGIIVRLVENVRYLTEFFLCLDTHFEVIKIGERYWCVSLSYSTTQPLIHPVSLDVTLSNRKSSMALCGSATHCVWKSMLCQIFSLALSVLSHKC